MHHLFKKLKQYTHIVALAVLPLLPQNSSADPWYKEGNLSSFQINSAIRKIVKEGRRVEDDPIYVDSNKEHYDLELPDHRQLLYFPNSRQIWLRLLDQPSEDQYCAANQKAWIDIIDNGLEGQVEEFYFACRHYWDAEVFSKSTTSINKSQAQQHFAEAIQEVANNP